MKTATSRFVEWVVIPVVVSLFVFFVLGLAQGAGPRTRQAPLPPQAPPVRTACICGDSCACKPGVCPSQCPVTSKPDLVTTTGQVIRWTGSAYVFVGAAPSVSGCVNGQCPLPKKR